MSTGSDAKKQIVEIGRAMVRIDADSKGKTRPVSGEVECPRCGGVMKYWVGGARAMTANCVDPNCMQLRG